MGKIGKRVVFCLFFGLFITAFYSNAAGQDNLSVQATVSKATVYAGRPVKLSITIKGDFNKVSLPDLPDIKGFRLANPVPSISRHFSYINGVTNTSYTYTYFLTAVKTGTYTIPSVSIEIDGKKYTTEPITVEVIDRGSAATDADSGKPDIFLKMKVSDKTVAAGEQITASVVLYFKTNLQVSTYRPIPGWKAEGFWKERLKTPKRPTVKTVIINGMRYHKARLLQFALFPVKPGKLTISPYQVNVIVEEIAARRNPFSSFFGSFSANQRRLKLKTEPVTVEVNPLPGSPEAKFTGAVGSFNIKRVISADTVKVGETIEIKTVISGTGNIPLITKPDYKLPPDLEVYQPQSSVKIKRTGKYIKGRKTFTDIVVPRNPGLVTIPAVTLSWYSPSKDKYVKEKLPSKTIFVKAADNAVAANTGTDRITFTPVTGLVNWVSPAQSKLISYWWFWAGLLLPIIGFIIGYRRKLYKEKMRNNYTYARSQRAEAEANKRLQKAVEHAENDHLKKAYNNLQKAMTGFIADKLDMPEAGLSIDQYIKALEEHEVNRELIKNTRMLLNKCATINYAPDKSDTFLKSHVGLAESIIKKLKKEL